MSEKTIKFDPTTTISAEYGIFGIPMSEDESKVVLVPAPWEVTTSYGKGASRGPKIIRQASEQIDLFDLEVGKSYEVGYHMRDFPKICVQKTTNTKLQLKNLLR